MRVFLLNGLPTSLLAEASEHMIGELEFWLISKEALQKILNEAIEVVNAIRHNSTKELVLSLIENKNKVKDVQFVSIKDMNSDDVVVIIAPRQLQARGVEQEVKWEDLVLVRIWFRGLPIYTRKP